MVVCRARGRARVLSRIKVSRVKGRTRGSLRSKALEGDNRDRQPWSRHVPK